MSRQYDNRSMLERPITSLLIRMTIPSIIGLLGIMSFNIVDTWFVAKLGTEKLAAITFTFPVVMIINSLSLGIGIGVMTLVSKVGGRDADDKKRMLATSSLILGLIIAAVIIAIGITTIDPLFRFLKADNELLPYIKEYMLIWYPGSLFIVVPMIGDHILRGLGDMKTPAYVMLCASLSNCILDPILIFGFGAIPAMGIKGAALATVISRMFTAIVSISILIFRENLIIFRPGLNRIKTIVSSFSTILFIGLPNSLVRIVPPASAAVFTAMLAKYGKEAVAGFGVAAKIEMFALTVIIAFSITAAVFTGQNLAVGNHKRAQQGVWRLQQLSAIYGIIVSFLLIAGGRFICKQFDSDPAVYNVGYQYLQIISFSYIFLSFIMIAISIMNVLHKPLSAAVVSISHMFLFSVPLAFVLSGFWGSDGIFAAIAIANTVIGLVMLRLSKKQLKTAADDFDESDFDVALVE